MISGSDGEILRDHRLADGVLPFAPRLPFAPFAVDALAAAAAITAAFPEKRGILSHVVRAYGGEGGEPSPAGVTIEAHFDATAIPAALGDRLLELGFEPDGFARFVPAHFADHFTLKFKVAGNDVPRRRMLRAEVEASCASLIAEVERDWPDLEAYLELETYSEGSRRRWPGEALGADWKTRLPLGPAVLKSVLPPCDAAEAERTGQPLTLAKRADLHLKVARATPEAPREALIEALVATGFYRVLTWAGNDVLTAQFSRMSDARRCFAALADFGDRAGGVAELTLEPVVRVWRSGGGGKRLGALPPLVLSIAE